MNNYYPYHWILTSSAYGNYRHHYLELDDATLLEYGSTIYSMYPRGRLFERTYIGKNGIETGLNP